MSNEFESCENSIENLEGEFPVFVARIDASMESPESTEILDVVLTSKLHAVSYTHLTLPTTMLV